MATNAVDSLPIRRLTIYKHGLANVERAGRCEGDSVELTFPTEAMDDILKSLVVVDSAGGVVTGVDLERAEDRSARLAEEALHLSPERSLLDLLRDLRGHRVTIGRQQGGTITGTIIGIDVESEHVLKRPIVSVLTDTTSDSASNESSATIVPVPLCDVADIGLTSDADNDVRRVLRTWRGQDRSRSTTIRLSEGAHDLRIAYVMPAPAWRVSYRLVVEAETMLLQGFGLFDNTFDEDLTDVAVTLVAGMPVSFRYRLYEGQVPQRPESGDDLRTLAAPVEFASMAAPAPAAARARAPKLSATRAAMAMSGESASSISFDEESADFDAAGLTQSMTAAATGEGRGSLFAYVAPSPVTAGRGRSVLVPLVSQELEGRRELLYKSGAAANGNPPSPMASLRLKNSTGLTLERGPVTVLEHGGYGGEAIVAFSPPDASITIPYAIELGIRVRELQSSQIELRSVRVRDRYLLIEETAITTHTYFLSSTLASSSTVTVEHVLRPGHALLDTSAPRETGEGRARWDVTVASHAEAELAVREAIVQSRYEEVRHLDGDRLRTYLSDRRVGQALHDGLESVLALYRRVDEIDAALAHNDSEQESLYESQGQARQNLGALAPTGDEGKLRSRYVQSLQASEDRLQALASSNTALAAERVVVESQVTAALDALAST